MPPTTKHQIQSLDPSPSSGTLGLSSDYPWTSAPLIVSAPMRVMSGPSLAVSVSSAGGIGFIGPGLSPESTAIDLEEATRLITSSSSSSSSSDSSSSPILPVGVGFQLWNGDLSAATEAVARYRPAAVWLFAPRDGSRDQVDEWVRALRSAGGGDTKIWLQVGTLREVREAVQRARPGVDVLVVQGSEAGGHGRTEDGTPLSVLVPEVLDLLAANDVKKIPVFAAGGISDGRGVSAALCLGAAGAVMGTRFLCSSEARIKKGYRDAVLEARDGGVSTVKTHLYNHLRGTYGWPAQWTPRTVVNRSWVEHKEGVEFDELKRRHEESLKAGDGAWGREEGRTATYAGMGVGLVNEVKGAREIVEEAREEATAILKGLAGRF
ncbi:putative 2-nitropropane dioxygenase precursor [Cladorrhinum samala]|uniref:2-nitropropane dioxygenase n=1 Tax=Cladorrhinum samala TaxID=585594 RepID=A0AAV9HXL8_9PEZI|nr:putative 2-nitropropane dioxygenase precursor [Cladorrhinum samala]